MAILLNDNNKINKINLNSTSNTSYDIKCLKVGETVLWSKPITIQYYDIRGNGKSTGGTITAGSLSEPSPSSTYAGARTATFPTGTYITDAQAYWGDTVSFSTEGVGDTGWDYTFVSATAYYYRDTTQLGSFTVGQNPSFTIDNTSYDFNKIVIVSNWTKSESPVNTTVSMSRSYYTGTGTTYREFYGTTYAYYRENSSSAEKLLADNSSNSVTFSRPYNETASGSYTYRVKLGTYAIDDVDQGDVYGVISRTSTATGNKNYISMYVRTSYKAPRNVSYYQFIPFSLGLPSTWGGGSHKVDFYWDSGIIYTYSDGDNKFEITDDGGAIISGLTKTATTASFNYRYISGVGVAMGFKILVKAEWGTTVS